ncbi:integrase domain-containing protein [Azohydromonas lata]|uniref:Integrase domain-containing protein n=1 Tax=Azohydromonas lata TaxID=45677 RepID=A0ABU5I8S4_9BURK|nr:integrase domain-containing protein [Azohydromonas lata]MDZ5455031.1 integrase domain-containing protein [Azohydromonas lata]
MAVIPFDPSRRRATQTAVGGGGSEGAAVPQGGRDPDEELRRLPLGTSDYVRVVDAILRKNNWRHSTKDKNVSRKTMRDRSTFLVAFFRALRHETEFKDADPRELGGRHVEAMVRRWVSLGRSTATIHNYLSFLRTYAGWIGKPGMVLAPQHYVGEASPHAHRYQVAVKDKSWSAADVDIDDLIRRVGEFDMWVGLQLELCAKLGLRPKEARHFRPHGAIVPRERALERDAQAFPHAQWFVRVVHGTKGGRPRHVPLANPAQRALIERLQALVPSGQFVGRPEHSAAQSQRRFYYVLQQFGITKSALGVVAHGLRHQHANDLYEALASSPSPVRGGQLQPAQDVEARSATARVLGHNRPRVTGCYIGSSRAFTDGLSRNGVDAADADQGLPEPGSRT